MANLKEIYQTVKHNNEPKLSSDDQHKQLILQLTSKIVNACSTVDEFIGAVERHRYPPIKLSQREAEFLKAGSFRQGLDLSLFTPN